MFKRLLVGVIMLVLLAACTNTENSAPGGDILAPLPTAAETDSPAEGDPALPTLLERLSENPDLVFFANGLNNVGLADELQSGGPFTVLAASSLAFTRSELIVSQMDPAILGPVLENHVIEGAYNTRENLAQAGSVGTLNGTQLPVVEVEDKIIVDYAWVQGEPIQASNGVIYVIDTLLLPPETGPEKSVWGVLNADGRFTTFVAMLEGTQVMTDLRFRDGYDAVLAPTDEAFANMPANVTTYLENNPFDYEFVAFFHLLTPDGWPRGTDLTVADMIELGTIQTRVGNPGFGFEELIISQTEAGVTVNEAQVIQGDIDATNGIVHAIDTVLIPQTLLEHVDQ
ncbi:MAG: fasciclin domain-containing protein [Anaerolineaceae bacterium]|nr:fasciclin domain-containing protein [Anaerolineaceae bacterium]